MGPFAKPWSLSFMVACKTPRSISWSPELFTLASKTSRARLATLLSASVGSWLVDISGQSDSTPAICQWGRNHCRYRLIGKRLENKLPPTALWRATSSCAGGFLADVVTCVLLRFLDSLQLLSSGNHSPHHFRSALCNLRHWVVQANCTASNMGPGIWSVATPGCLAVMAASTNSWDLLRSPVNSYCFQSCTRDIPHDWSANKACIWRQGIFSRDLHDVVELSDHWQTGGRKYLARAKIHTCEISFGTCHEWSSSRESKSYKAWTTWSPRTGKCPK